MRQISETLLVISFDLFAKAFFSKFELPNWGCS